MNNSMATIETNRMIARDMFEMKLSLRESTEEIRPGQFINIRLDGLFLRRPISICDWSEQNIGIIYKTVGRGTERMSLMKAGEVLDILWPLGNGFDLSPFGIGCEMEEIQKGLKSMTPAPAGVADPTPVLIGGGAGVPPMYGLCKRLARAGKKPRVVLGFGDEKDVFYVEEFLEYAEEVILMTEDGSAGEKGLVTDAIGGERADGITGMDTGGMYVYACGPEPMLRAIHEVLPKKAGAQMSFEERMGCGFGACMGCSCRTKYGSKRICKDGPVLKREEIIW